MKTTIRRSTAALTAAAAMLMLFPVYEGTAVEYVSIPLDAAVDYTGDYVFYEYWPDSEYIPNDSLGYTIVPEDSKIDDGGENELGLIPLEGSSIYVDDIGRLGAKEIGTYSLTATLNDGYKWSDGSISDKHIKFEIQKRLVAPEFVQDRFPYQKGVVHTAQLTESVSAFCNISGSLSAENPGIYDVVFTLKDSTHYTFDRINNVKSHTITYYIDDCTHEAPDGTSYWNNGYCSNCGAQQEPNLNDNGTPADESDDFWEIGTLGELCWYMENRANWGNWEDNQVRVKLTDNIVVNETLPPAEGTTVNKLPDFYLESAVDVIDGQGHYISGLWQQGFSNGANFGTIRNLGIVNSYVEDTGAICYENDSIIENCYVEAEVTDGGGIAYQNGCEYTLEEPAVISNCYVVGTMKQSSSTDKYGAICAVLMDNAEIENSFYSAENGTDAAYTAGSTFYTDENGEGVTQFAAGDAVSGVLCAEMNEQLGEEFWFQNIDNGEVPDKYPVPDSTHGSVLVKTDCLGIGKAGTNDSTKENVHVGQAADGICDVCGECEEPQYDEANGGYQINNAGNLLWYAEKLNEADDDTGLDAVLCSDISLNESLLNSSGEVANSDADKWTPMNAKNITFDGQNHTISGLYIDNSTEETAPSGLFGAVDGCTIKNVSVADSYIRNDSVTGGIAGSVADSTIENCAFTGSIVCTDDTTSGSIVGEADSDTEISGCLTIGLNGESLDVFGSASSPQVENSLSVNAADDTDKLASGEIANQLGDSWGQVLGIESVPKLGGSPVYLVSFETDSDKITVPESVYTNSDGIEYNQAIGSMDSTLEYTITNAEDDSEVTLPLTDNITVMISLVVTPIEINTKKTTEYSVRNGKAITAILLTDYISNYSKLGGVSFSMVDSTYCGLSISGDTLVGTPNKAGTFEQCIEITAGNGETEKLTLTFNSAKGIPTNPVTPSVSYSIPYQSGRTLSEAPLSDKKWKWVDSSTKLILGVREYLAYLQVDDENYDYSGISGYNPATGRVERGVTVDYYHSGNTPVLDTASLTLNGDIGMNIYIIFPTDPADFVNEAKITFNDVEYDIPSALQSDGRYKFSYWVNAKEMHDGISIHLFYDGYECILENNKHEWLDLGYTICVADYLEAVKGQDDELGELARNMLKYGEASQKHFSYNTDVMSEWTDAENTAYQSKFDALTADDFATYKATKTGDLPSGLTFRSMSLLLKTETAARLSFVANDGIKNYAFTLDGASITPTNLPDTDEYAVDLFGIAAKDLDAVHTVKVGNCTITYSALSYVGAVFEKTKSDSLLTVAKALYLYWQAAENYFAAAS